MPIIRRYRLLVDAHLAAATLEGSGIPVELVDEATMQANPTLNLSVGGVGLAVAPENVAESLRILGVDLQKEAQAAERHAQVFSRKVRFAAIVGSIATAIIFCCYFYLTPENRREIIPLLFMSGIIGGGIGLASAMFRKSHQDH